MTKQRFIFSNKYNASVYDTKTQNFLTPTTTARYLNTAYNALLQAKEDFIYIDKHQLDADANFSIDRINATLKQLQ